MILQNTIPASFGTLDMLVVIAILMTIVIGLISLEVFLEVQRVKKRISEQQGAPVVRKTTWMDLFRRKGITMDKFVEGHNYDGIQEYDNSPPAWFNWIFYLSILFAFVYLMYYHVLKIGDLSQAEYEKQVKAAAPILAKAQERAIRLADQPRLTDTKDLEMGKMIFLSNCIICHGEKGQGNIGPNLTDDYWIHGGQYPQMFRTIFNGVPEKGMLSWKKSLKADDIRKVASYVYTLRGTNPPNPKPPQGVKEGGSTATNDNTGKPAENTVK